MDCVSALLPVIRESQTYLHPHKSVIKYAYKFGIWFDSSSLLQQIESLFIIANVTVGYYVTRGDMVYTSSAVVEALSAYGLKRLMADIRQFVPVVQTVPIPAAHWRPIPAISLMLKTGQRCQTFQYWKCFQRFFTVFR